MHRSVVALAINHEFQPFINLHNTIGYHCFLFLYFLIFLLFRFTVDVCTVQLMNNLPNWKANRHSPTGSNDSACDTAKIPSDS